MLQWSRSPERAETNYRKDFDEDGIKASMEPLSGESGNLATPAALADPRSRFNGAALRRERKHFNDCLTVLGHEMLQWSRSPERAETSKDPINAIFSKTASMEPLSGESGNADGINQGKLQDRKSVE